MLKHKTVNNIIIEDFIRDIKNIINLTKRVFKETNIYENYEDILEIYQVFPDIIGNDKVKKSMRNVELVIKNIKRANPYLQIIFLEKTLNDLFDCLCKEVGFNIILMNMPEFGRIKGKDEMEKISEIHVYDTLSQFGKINYLYRLSGSKYLVYFFEDEDAQKCYNLINGNKIGNNNIYVRKI